MQSIPPTDHFIKRQFSLPADLNTLTDQGAYHALAICQSTALASIRTMLSYGATPGQIALKTIAASNRIFTATLWQRAANYILALEAAAGPATTCEHGCSAADGDYCEECHQWDRADEAWDSRCDR